MHLGHRAGNQRWQQRARRTMANQPAGKAPSDSPALKPYRGKLAVRNFRGGNGNVGIIRSPVRAIALPDSREVFTDLSAWRNIGRRLNTALSSINGIRPHHKFG